MNKDKITVEFCEEEINNLRSCYDRLVPISEPYVDVDVFSIKSIIEIWDKRLEKLTVQKVLDNIDIYGDKEREAPLKALIAKLSPLSLSMLKQFQEEWITSKSYNIFALAQNELIKKWVTIEISESGKSYRESIGLPPLELTTELN